MSESETLYQVLHVRDGVEMFTYAQPYDEALSMAENLNKAGHNVLSVMTRDGVSEYIRTEVRKAREGLFKLEPFFPAMEETLPKSAGVKVDPAEELSKTLDTAARAQRTKVADRRISVDYALRMRETDGDARTAEELVADAETILKFLEG